MLCQMVIGPQCQNFTLKCCFLVWRRATENLDCYPKMGNFFHFYLTFLKVAPEAKCVLQFVSKKKWREAQKYLDFSFVQVKNHFAHFGGLNKMFFSSFFFEFSFLRMYIYVIGRYLQIKKNTSLKVPLIFFTPPYCTRVLHQMYEWMMRHCIRVNLTHLVFFYSDFLESGKAELTAKFSRWPGNVNKKIKLQK